MALPPNSNRQTYQPDPGPTADQLALARFNTATATPASTPGSGGHGLPGTTGLNNAYQSYLNNAQQTGLAAQANQTGGIATTQNAFGPQQMMTNANLIYQQMMNSPLYRAQVSSLLTGQAAGQNAAATAGGRSGTSKGGVGQAQQQMMGSQAAMGRGQLAAGMYGQALNAAGENLNTQAGVARYMDQILHPESYAPYGGGAAGMQQMRDYAQMARLQFQEASETERLQMTNDANAALANLDAETQQQIAALTSSTNIRVAEIYAAATRYAARQQREPQRGDWLTAIASFLPFL